MKPSGVLIALLVLAAVVVDYAVLTAAQRRMHLPDPAVTLALALGLSQVSLAAIWLALGRRPAFLRLIGTAVVVAAWTRSLASLPDSPHVEMWAAWLTAQTAAVSLALLVARSRGLGMTDVPAGEETETPTARAKRLQFSILHLLGWMTAVAVVLGMLKCLPPSYALGWNSFFDSHTAVFVGSHVVVAWTALWTALGTGRPAVRLVALPLATITAFGALWLYVGVPQRDVGRILVLYVLEALLLLGPLWVVRLAGWHLETRSESRTAT